MLPPSPPDASFRSSFRPNVTGSLHMGHMLEHTEIDVVIRRIRVPTARRVDERLAAILRRSRPSSASFRRPPSGWRCRVIRFRAATECCRPACDAKRDDDVDLGMLQHVAHVERTGHVGGRNDERKDASGRTWRSIEDAPNRSTIFDQLWLEPLWS